MQTTPHGWTILDADAGILSLGYHFSGEGTANSFTVRLPSGGLLLVSPSCDLSREQLDDLRPYGDVEAAVANNGYHHLGIGRLRALVPGVRVYAAPGAVKRIAKKSKDAGSLELLSALTPELGEDIAIIEAPASRAGETWLRAKMSDGYAWFASDMLINLERLPSNIVARTVFKWSGSGPGYRIFHLALMLIFKDKRTALTALREDVRRYPPRVMVPAHGEVLVGDTVAADTLALLDAALGGAPSTVLEPHSSP